MFAAVAFLFLSLFSFNGSAQTHQYLFNNNFNETNGGPSLTQLVSCGAGPGSFGPVTTVDSQGTCLTFDAFCFNAGGGLQYPNPGGIISNSYTINMYVKYTAFSGWTRIIDFTNSNSDVGMYIMSNCLNYYGIAQAGPCPYFVVNQFYLISIVRDGATTRHSVYVNGAPFSSFIDGNTSWLYPQAGAPINLFRDDNFVPCNVDAGCIAYFSVSPTVATAADIAQLWTNLPTLIQAIPSTPPNAGITPSSATLNCITPSTTLTATGGGTYHWSGGSTGATNIVTAGNTYSVTITDASGCTASASSVVTKDTIPPTAVIAPATGTLTCATTSIPLIASGGTGYSWNIGGTNATNTVSSPNTYRVTVTGANGCTATASAVVSQNITPPTAAVSPPNGTLTCSTTSLTLTASGGTSYSWAAGPNTATNTVNAASTYIVTVTGANGCTATANSVVSQNITPPVAAVNPATYTLTCSNPSTTLTASGGGTYNWGTVTTSTNTVNAPSTYTVTVTGANGCTAAASSVVSQNVAAPVASVSPSSANVTCASPNVTLTASGGGTYSWNGGPNTATNTVSSAGTYTVTVTNANGCSATATATVTLNTTPPTAAINPSSFILTCSNPSTTLTASGGSSYNWGSVNTATNTVNSPATYTVTVTDANGCTASASASVTQDITPPTASVTPANTSLTCATPSILLTAGGGGTYNWSGGGGTSATLTVNTANTYTVTVTAANGCTASASSVIGQNVNAPALSVSPAAATLTCTTTSITITATGTGTFNWGSGNNTSSTTASAQGTYTVTLTDANGCTAAASSVVSQNIAPPVASISPSSGTITCSATSVTLTASGGGTYDWGGAIFTAANTVSTAATYTVTVTDGTNGCSATATATVSQNTTPPAAAVSPTTGTLTCATTSISLTASGGGTYDWGGNASATNTVNAANTYTVTVTGTNGCTATASSTITQNITPPSAAISPASFDLTCTSPSTTLTATGGTGYDWGGSILTATNTVNAANTYTVVVTGANGCTATASAVVTSSIAVPPAAVSPSSAVLDCNTTSVTLTASGGISYNWGSVTTATNTVTQPNTYTVIVTDASGCTGTASAVITQDITPPTASVSPATADITCVTFSVTLTASGGGTYDWGGANFTATNTVTSANTYTVIVTGANGCTAAASSVVSQNTTPPTASISPSSGTLTCTTLSIGLTAGGGVSYDWGSTQTALNTVSTPNTYTVTVTGANGCTATSSANIIQDITAPAAAVSPTSGLLTCATTSITLTASGGTGYDWGGSVITATKSVSNPNTYTVIVTGANGCTATASSNITQDIVQPNVSVASGVTLTCAVLSSTLTASSTTNNATFDWGGSITTATYTVTQPGTYTVTVTDPVNGCTSNQSGTVLQDITAPNVSLSNTGILSCVTSSVTITASSTTPNVTYDWGGTNTTTSSTVTTAGSYNVTITDPANSCTALGTNTVQQNTTPPAVSIATPATLNCINSSVTLTASSIVVGVAYDWGGSNTNATYTVTTPGAYTVSATDPANGCTASVAVNVNQNLTIPTVSINPPDTITCHSPSVTLSATTSAVIPAYNWGGNNTNATYSVSVAGTYSLTMTDNDNGCTATTTADVADIPLMVLSETHTNVSCFGFSDGAIDLTVAGGLAPFAYAWDNTAVTEDVSSLSAATYTVIVTDAINCTVTLPVTIAQPANITVTETHVNVSCNGFNDGSINITVTGGNPPYSYRWNDNLTTEDRNSLAPNTYDVTVTYNNSCTTSLSATITEPAGVALQPTVTNPTCATLGDDGKVDIATTGGTLPYSFAWSNGITAAMNSNLGPGSYSLTVTDAHGCSLTDTYVLNYIYDFVADASPFVTIDLGATTLLNVTLTGNTGNYTTTWSPSYALGCIDCASPDASPVVSTLYNVTVQNSVGCISTDTVTVAVNKKYEVFVPNAFTPNGDNVNPEFQIFGNMDGVEYMQIQIFNRLGERVFESYDHQFKWDGTFKGEPLAPQIFTYQLRLTWLDGKKDELRKGTISLLK